ncbi:MAG: transporter [Deltaproteobacteria bacterium]|nr:transporter [Deltaproteobacteria bacterium]TLN01183.1 MAG: transporter [bacterium]
MLKILIDNPLLLLFLVAAIGYPLGRIKICGSSLGVASVLFTGLAVGSLHPELKLPEIIYILGVALFVYTVGLANGPAFLASLRRQGLRNNLLVVGVLIFAAGLTIVAQKLFQLRPALASGMFAGALTNTPALAAILDIIKHTVPREMLNRFLADPVVGYSITYPMGVIGSILSISFLQRLWKVDYAAEAKQLRGLGVATEPLRNITIRVTSEDALGASIEELRRRNGWDIIFGRIRHDDSVSLADPNSHFDIGDLVTVVGIQEELERVTRFLGETSEDELDLDRREFDYRRIFVSNPKLVGRRLRDLRLKENHGALITRIRRGDDDVLANGDTVLELGDRVRVITDRERIDSLSTFFGDSYRAVSEVDILTFSLGLALGLFLGTLPVPLPGGSELRLGFAGGPLLVALVLGTLGRTGPLVWTLPYGANLTLRQIGLILFLAGVGTRAGYGFITTFTQEGGVLLFGTGIVISCTVAVSMLWIGYRLLKIPMSLLIGMLAGLQTQSAVLGYALEQSRNELPTVGYASVYPVATITKILLAQLLLTMLMH